MAKLPISRDGLTTASNEVLFEDLYSVAKKSGAGLLLAFFARDGHLQSFVAYPTQFSAEQKAILATALRECALEFEKI